MWLARVLSYIQCSLAVVFPQVTWPASTCSRVCLKEPGAARIVLEWLRQRSLQSTTGLSWPCTSYLFYISLFAFFFFLCSSPPSPSSVFFLMGCFWGFSSSFSTRNSWHTDDLYQKKTFPRWWALVLASEFSLCIYSMFNIFDGDLKLT